MLKVSRKKKKQEERDKSFCFSLRIYIYLSPDCSLCATSTRFDSIRSSKMHLPPPPSPFFPLYNRHNMCLTSRLELCQLLFDVGQLVSPCRLLGEFFWTHIKSDDNGNHRVNIRCASYMPVHRCFSSRCAAKCTLY